MLYAPRRGGRRRTWWAGTLVVLLGLALLLPGLGLMAARDSTDARYLEVAREMAASGDWRMPRLAGVPHLEKPPLAYWAAAAGFAVLGVTPLAGRLLSQAALAATALLVHLWARKRLGPGPAWIAAGILLTSGLVFASSRALNTDLFQLFFLTGGLLALYAGSEGHLGWTAVGVALLTASLVAKGPIALLVGACVFVPFLALRARERRLPAAGVAVGLVVGGALGLPWYAGVVASNPALVSWFVEHQLIARVSGGGSDGHLHGLLYLPVHLVVGWLPWTPLVARSIWQLRPQRGVRAPATELFLLLWALVPCVLFQLFATKLATYLLPAFPAGALLVAWASSRGELEDRTGRLAVASAAAVTAIASVALAAFLVAPAGILGQRSWLELEDLRAPGLFALGLVAVGAVASALVVQAPGTPTRWSLPRIAAATGFALALGFTALAPALPDSAGAAAVVRSVPGARVVQYGFFSPSLFFYVGDLESVFVAVESRHAALARRDPRALRLGLRREDVETMVAEGVPTFVLAKRSSESALAQAFGLVTVRRTRRHALLANARAAAALPGHPRDLASH